MQLCDGIYTTRLYDCSYKNFFIRKWVINILFIFVSFSVIALILLILYDQSPYEKKVVIEKDEEERSLSKVDSP